MARDKCFHFVDGGHLFDLNWFPRDGDESNRLFKEAFDRELRFLPRKLQKLASKQSQVVLLHLHIVAQAEEVLALEHLREYLKRSVVLADTVVDQEMAMKGLDMIITDLACLRELFDALIEHGYLLEVS